jgi:hypothetical protein
VAFGFSYRFEQKLRSSSVAANVGVAHAHFGRATAGIC